MQAEHVPDFTLADARAAQRRDEAREAAHASVAASYAGLLSLQIASGVNAPMRTQWGGGRLYPVTDILADCSEERRAKLLQACSLARLGKYEASSRALLEYVEGVCQDYGRDMADEFAGDE